MVTTRPEPARPARRRAYAVSITPFDHRGRIDEHALRAHLRRLADPGLGVYVGGGGSGEGHSLSAAEHRQVLEIAVDEVGQRVPVRAMGVGPRHASEAIGFVSTAAETGVEAIQIYSPELSHGHTLGPDELHRFLDDVLASTAAPCVLSTHRSVGYAIPLDLIDDLTLEHRHVIGVNCTQDAGYLSGLIARVGQRIDVHVGGEAGAIDAIALGAAGFLSSTANLAPRLVSRVARSLERGSDVAATLEGYGELLGLTALLRGSSGVARLKAVLGAFGLPGGLPRPPLLPLPAAAVAHLVDTIARSNVSEIEGWT